MCGIWLLCGVESSASLHCNDAFTKIGHRGPDAWRLEMDARMNNVLLGFHRLSIVDPLHGMQPMRLHQYPHLSLLCNGEIFNCMRLAEENSFNLETKCDVEVILHMYVRYGIEAAANSLDGEFAFALVDSEKQQVHLARDPFGVRPLFILRTQTGVLGVCSEAKGLISMARTLPSNDWNIEQFTPSFIESFNVEKKTGLVSLEARKNFYEIGVTKPAFSTMCPWSSLKHDDVSANIRTLLTEAVRKRLMADRRIGCLLSGGLDSSLVSALILKLSRECGIDYKIQTFSIGMGTSPDLIAAREVAKHIGSEHHEYIFSEKEVAEVLDKVLETIETADITTVRASLPMYLLSRFIRQCGDTVVIMSGEGADELAQGYIYFRDAPDALSAHEESLRLLRDVHLYDGLRADRTTSAFSLELRLPFLDLQFTSYYLSLQHESRRPKNGMEKHLLRSAFAGTGLLPDSILWRPKEAFSDGVAARKKSLFQTIQEEVDRRLLEINLVNELQKFSHCPPTSKESLYYRRFFEKTYGGQAEKLMPYFWMPRWTDATDPSARFINHYNAAQE